MKKLLALGALIAAWIAWRSAAPPPPSPRPAVPLVGPHEGRVSAILGEAPPVTGDVHGRVVRWTDPPETWIAHDGAIRRILAVDADLLTVGADGTVARWRRDGQVIWRRRHPEALNDAAWVDGILVVATARGTVARLEADGPRWQSRGAHGQAAFALLPAEGAVISTGADGRIVTRAIADGAVRREIGASSAWIGALARGVDGLLFVDGNGTLGRDRRDAFALQAAFAGPGIALIADGAWIAAGGERGEIVLFTAQGARQRSIATGAPVMSLAWQGEHLLSGGGADGAVRIWRVKDGAEVGRLPPTATASQREIP